MIRLLTAYSREADDPEKAIRDIQTGLNLAEEQLACSAALVFCHSAFVESGVMEAVCKSLPFVSVGCTSHYFALPGAADDFLLTVTVLTSDDVEFAAGVSEPLYEENVETAIGALCEKTAAALNGKPALIFSMLPTMLNLGSDVIAAAVDRACGGAPVFGSCALDVDIWVRHPRIIFQGVAHVDRVALLYCKGPVKPRFFFLPFPGTPIYTEEAVITGVAGNLITGINNRPAVPFMKDLGLTLPGESGGISTFPLIVDYHDGAEREVAVMLSATAEGALVTTRHLRVGGTLSIGSITARDVLESAKTLLQKIKNAGDDAGIIIFSCFARNIVLGGNYMAEIELIREELAGLSEPYVFLYSAGELCPSDAKTGGTANRFYQYAIVACQF
jgi:hypothetical protein